MGPRIRMTYLDLVRKGCGVGPLCPRGLPMVFGPAPEPKADANNYLVPNPTRPAKLKPVVYPSMYWALCPLVRHRISMLEASGSITRMQGVLERDPEKMTRLKQAHEAHRADFIARGGDPHLEANVGGGNGKGIKCLHTHFAHYLATGDNIVGEMVAKQLEHLPECTRPCVVRSKDNSDFETNRLWHLPSSEALKAACDNESNEKSNPSKDG